MPIKTAAKRHSRAPRHKHTKHYLQAYWPYLPMLLVVLIGLIFGGNRPFSPASHRGVLSYATEMSAGALLAATNVQRANNGAASLTTNSQLNSAAQAKANDMVARNYWSHNTPDGQEPWVFIQNAGYKYSKAGENLAYGFATSSDTVTGWMNSATHKANLLDTAFTEVGFGIANSSSFNSSGEETVVVAMYGKPQVLAAESSAPAPAPAKKTTTTQPAETKPIETKPPVEKPAEKKQDAVVASNKPIIEPATQTVTRANIWTKGKTPWVVGAIVSLSGIGAVILLVRHGLGFHRLVRDGERFVLKHPLFDLALVSLLMLGYVLSATKGFIK